MENDVKGKIAIPSE